MREIDDIHVPFIAWLHKLEIPFVYHRPDRKSGITSGWPDFTVLWMGRQVCIECKTPEGKLSEVQENVHAFIRKSGNRVEICRSVEECKEAVKNILCERGTGENDSNLERRLEVSVKLRTHDLYIIEWKGTPFVVAPHDGTHRLIRQANATDVATIPRLVDDEENLN